MSNTVIIGDIVEKIIKGVSQNVDRRTVSKELDGDETAFKRNVSQSVPKEPYKSNNNVERYSHPVRYSKENKSKLTTPATVNLFTREYTASNGVPIHIHNKANEYGSQASELKRIETFMYENVAVWIPRRAVKMSSEMFAELKRSKVDAGAWKILKRSVCSYYHLDMVRYGEMWTLTGSYLREIASYEPLGRSQFNSQAYRKHYVRKPRIHASMDATLGKYLNNGTGLTVNHSRMLEKLLTPCDHKTYVKYLRNWKMLVKLCGDKVITPVWKTRTYGILACSNPALQSLSSDVRNEALQSVDDRKLHSIDFRACHFNTLRALNGLEPLHEPWQYVSDRLASDSIHIPKQALSKLTNSIIHGISRQYFLYLNYGLARPDVLERIYEVMRAMIINDKEPTELLRLQSELMRAIIETAMVENVPPGLPVYDEILTPDVDVFTDIMKRCSIDLLGAELPVKITPSKSAIVRKVN